MTEREGMMGVPHLIPREDWQFAKVVDGNHVEVRPPISTPGGYVTLLAEMDCVAAFSACPQDMVPVNGLAMRPTEAHFEILD